MFIDPKISRFYRHNEAYNSLEKVMFHGGILDKLVPMWSSSPSDEKTWMFYTKSILGCFAELDHKQMMFNYYLISSLGHVVPRLVLEASQNETQKYDETLKLVWI